MKPKRRYLTNAFWIVQAMAVTVVAQMLLWHWQDKRDFERRFRMYSSADHYLIGVRYGTLDDSGRSRDVNLAIRHLEAIPAGDKYYAPASRILPLLTVERDKTPQEFHATLQESYRKCMDKDLALQKALAAQRPCPGLVLKNGDCFLGRCGTGVEEACSPLGHGDERIAVLDARP